MFFRKLFGEMWVDHYQTKFTSDCLLEMSLQVCFLNLEKSVYLSLEKDSFLATHKGGENKLRKGAMICVASLF